MIRKIENYIESRGVVVAVLTGLGLVLPWLALLGYQVIDLDVLVWVALSTIAFLLWALWIATRADLDRTYESLKRVTLALTTLEHTIEAEQDARLIVTSWAEKLQVRKGGDTTQELTKTYRVKDRVHFIWTEVGGTPLSRLQKKQFAVKASLDGADLVCRVSDWRAYDADNEIVKVRVYLPYPIENTEVTITITYDWPGLLRNLRNGSDRSEGFFWMMSSPIAAEGMPFRFTLSLDRELGIASALTVTPTQWRSNLRQRPEHGGWVVEGEENITQQGVLVGFRLGT